MTAMSANGTPTAPATPAAPAVPRKVIEMERLPKHLQQLLSWLSEDDWGLIEARVCHLPITRDLADALGFIDKVWSHASKAEYRSGRNRITGVEMDGYRARFDSAVQALLELGGELGRRAGLTEILARNRRLFDRHGIVPGKAQANAKNAAQKQPQRIDAA
jgi:hypothetical protein